MKLQLRLVTRLVLLIANHSLNGRLVKYPGSHALAVCFLALRILESTQTAVGYLARLVRNSTLVGRYWIHTTDQWTASARVISQGKREYPGFKAGVIRHDHSTSQKTPYIHTVGYIHVIKVQNHRQKTLCSVLIPKFNTGKNKIQEFPLKK